MADIAMIQHILADFKPGQVVEVVGGYYSNFSKGRIGIVRNIPKQICGEKNTTHLEFWYHITWGSGRECVSYVSVNDIKILDSFYYFDFNQNIVMIRKLQGIIDAFSFHLLHTGNFFKTEKEAEIYGRTQRYDYINMLEIIKKNSN